MSESTDDIAQSLKYREQQIFSDKAAETIKPSQSKQVLDPLSSSVYWGTNMIESVARIQVYILNFNIKDWEKFILSF